MGLRFMVQDISYRVSSCSVGSPSDEEPNFLESRRGTVF